MTVTSLMLFVIIVIIIIAIFIFIFIVFFTISTIILISILLLVVYFSNFSYVLVLHANLPNYFFEGITIEIKLHSFLCYPCHYNSFTIYLKLASVLIKLSPLKNYTNFYLLGIILCHGERYLFT